MNTYNGEVIPAGTPTQIAHKGQAIKRTVTVVIAGLILLNGIIALFLEVFDLYLADTPLAGLLAGASALLALIVTFLQRLMVMESLQDFLGKIGLGTGVEKEEPVDSSPADPVQNTTPPTFSE